MHHTVALIASFLVVAGCAITPVPPSPVTAPSASAVQSAVSPNSTPSAPPSPSTVPSPAQTSRPAELSVTGTGSCGGAVVINYGGCRPMLLLAATLDTDFSDWVMSDMDYFFETGDRGASEIPLTGPVESGPTSLEPGPWTVGLGVRNTSDVPSEPEWLEVLCVRAFVVAAGTQRVEIRGHFEQHCSIDVVLDDVPLPIECAGDTFYLLDDGGRDHVRTQTYPGTNRVTITVSGVDEPLVSETATVDMSDPACLEHRLIGPIVRGVLNGFDPISSDPAELVGRLMVLNNIGVGCSALIDRDGLTWDPTWPDGYTVSTSGLVKDESSLVAEAGDLIGVNGQELRRDGGCLDKTGFRVDEVAFIESARSPN